MFLSICWYAEQILKVVSEKVASGELEDASTTIGQMSSGLKERKTSKLRLAEEAEQAEVEEKEEKNDGKTIGPVLAPLVQRADTL